MAGLQSQASDAIWHDRYACAAQVITATPRQLESLVRLSEALARMRLSPTVEEHHVTEALRLMTVRRRPQNPVRLPFGSGTGNAPLHNRCRAASQGTPPQLRTGSCQNCCL